MRLPDYRGDVLIRYHLRQTVRAKQVDVASSRERRDDVDPRTWFGAERSAEMCCPGADQPQLLHGVIRRDLLESTVAEDVHTAITNVYDIHTSDVLHEPGRDTRCPHVGIV